MIHYKVLDGTVVRRGTAREILQQLLEKTSSRGSATQGMNVDQYARALVENAQYFMPSEAVDEFGDYPSLEDKALNMLNVMPASGTHIINVQQDGC